MSRMRSAVGPVTVISLAALLVSTAAEQPGAPAPLERTAEAARHHELRRFSAREAVQGVAVDDRHFYAIANRALGKYRKDTGERVVGWQGEKDGPIKHLNAGVVIGGLLYCAHSNYPEQPPASSVEIWDTSTLKHVRTHSFGVFEGSLTWVAPREDHWFACFAHYEKSGAGTGDPALTQVVKLDSEWRRVAGWLFPPALIERFAGHSSSGGAFGPDGRLCVTGHDAQELYVLTFPEAGSVLKWETTLAISAEGQAFAWDPVQTNIVYSISRKNREVIVSEVSLR
jgi:hypothetical protein